MQRMVLIAAALLSLACCNKADKIVSDLGYFYDKEQDIYGSKTTAWQRTAGYDVIIDRSSVPSGMVIDCEPVKFRYDGKAYMIELWKGQYDLCTGSEIGIYKEAKEGPLKWQCGEDRDMLDMSYLVKKNGAPLYRRKGVHWWLTGFKPGEFSEPEELVMEVAIDFGRVPGMQDPFVEELRRIGYEDVQVQGTVVSFVFDRPRTDQPPIDAGFLHQTQKKNELLVQTYNEVKKDAGVTDNSPRSMEVMVKKSPQLTLSLLRLRR